ncbi:hypothetical protein FD755_022033, partial [Muntiacus reevesi]
ETFSAEEHIYALPGSDVNLTCHARKKGFLVQTQWSEVTGKADLLAVYHPEHGFSCASRGPCGSLVAFREAPGNVFEWTLHLRNVSSSTAGKYECSFTLYPEGIQTKVYSLKIQTDVAQEEWRSNHTIEIEINGTLEIPCFQNTSLDISSALTFAWLVEDHGTQETLTARGQPTSNSTLFKDRVRTGADYRLYLSPVQVHDDGRTFSCRIVLGSGRVLRSSTTVKVFAKLEIPMIVENNSMDVIGERIFTCSLRNVFPTANLSWFIQRSFPQAEREEMYTASEKRKDKDGFWELKSVLTSVYDNKPAHSNNLTIWCMALSPAPGHKVWNSSSEKITFSLEYWSGLPFPSPWDLPDPGVEPTSSALAGRFFTTEPPGKYRDSSYTPSPHVHLLPHHPPDCCLFYSGASSWCCASHAPCQASAEWPHSETDDVSSSPALYNIMDRISTSQASLKLETVDSLSKAVHHLYHRANANHLKITMSTSQRTLGFFKFERYEPLFHPRNSPPNPHTQEKERGKKKRCSQIKIL